MSQAHLVQSVADDTDIAPISDQLFGSDLAGSFKKVKELAVDRQTARKTDRGRSFRFGDSDHYRKSFFRQPIPSTSAEGPAQTVLPAALLQEGEGAPAATATRSSTNYE
jgi:hypothetical protein